MNFNSDRIPDYEEIVNALGVSYGLRRQAKLELDLQNWKSPPIKPSIEDPSMLELKALATHLRYAFLGTNNTSLVIVPVDLNEEQVSALVDVLK